MKENPIGHQLSVVANRSVGLSHINEISEVANTDEERYAGVLAASHLELSALFLLSLSSNDTEATSNSFVKRIVPALPKRTRDNLAKSVTNYTHDTLIPLGLVGRYESTLKRGNQPVSFYTLTSEGVYIQPIVFYLVTALEEINSLYDTEIGLSDILSKTAGESEKGKKTLGKSGTTLTPYSCARIIEALAFLSDDETETFEHISQRINLPFTTTVKRIEALKEAGVVNCASINPEHAGQFMYTLTESLPEDVSIHADNFGLQFTRYILDNLQSRHTGEPYEFSSKSITDALYDDYQTLRVGEGKKVLARKTFQAYAGQIFSELSRKGLLKVEFKALIKLSTVNLTPVGKAVASVLETVKTACIDQMSQADLQTVYTRDFAFFLSTHGEALVARQKKSRKYQSTKGEQLSTAIEYLQVHGEHGVRASVFNEVLQINMGTYLTMMIRDGVVFRERGNSDFMQVHGGGSAKASYYFLTENAKAIIAQSEDISYEELVAQIKEI